MNKSKHSLSSAIKYSSCILIALFLSACHNQTPVEAKPVVDQLAELVDAKISSVTPEQVSEVFSLGSDSTDLQRDILIKELVGSVVEWDVKVYEVDYVDDVYKISSQPFPVKSKEAISMMRASIALSPSSDKDNEFLRKVKTNGSIRIRGKVQDVVLRTVVVIEPAILVL